MHFNLCSIHLKVVSIDELRFLPVSSLGARLNEWENDGKTLSV